MKIEEIIAKITASEIECSRSIPKPITEEEILKAEKTFQKAFNHNFPETYKQILRIRNGIEFNGMIIWPAKTEPGFDETIYQANFNLRQEFTDRFVYFANIDEELYVFDIKNQKYCATEYVGLPIWEEFSNAEEMFQFILKRAYDE